MIAPRNIAVLRALGGVGDVLTAMPALAQIRAAHPNARITYIGLPAVEQVVSRYPDLVDRFVSFPGFPGVPEHPFEARRLHDFLDTWRSGAQTDLLFQMHGSGSVSNVFAALLGAKRTAGYFIPGLWRPNEDNYSPFPDHLREIERWTALAERAGCPFVATPGFPVSEADRRSLLQIIPRLGVAPIAVVHPGASDPLRRWPPERFARIADELVSLGLRVVLTGTGSEKPITARVAAAMRRPALDLAGRTTLGEVAALIERAALTLTNDTGTSHIAAALGAPSITLFIASDPARWAAADPRLHVAVGSGVADVPAGHSRPRAHASFPEVEDVMSAVDRQFAVVAA